MISMGEIKPIARKLYYKNCRCCGRKNTPFEQRNWTACLKCTIDTREFQIEGAFNPRNHNRTVERTQKLLDNYLELLGILKFGDVWQQVEVVVGAGYAEAIYDGKKKPENWTGLKLTEAGRKVLGRPTHTRASKDIVGDSDGTS